MTSDVVQTCVIVPADDGGMRLEERCNVGGCGQKPEATVTIMGFGLRMCGEHARMIETALEQRQAANRDEFVRSISQDFGSQPGAVTFEHAPPEEL